MKYSEFQQYVDQVNSSSASSAVMYLVLKVDKVLTVRLMDIGNRYQADIKAYYMNELLSDIVDMAGDRDDDFDFQKLSTADDRANKVYEYDLDFPEDLKFIKDIYNHGVQQKFDAGKDELQHLFGYVVVIGTSQKKIALFRRHTPVNTFSPDRLCFFNEGTRFTKNTRPFIRVESNSHFVYFDNILLIKELRVLEQLIGFHDVIIREASHCVASSNLPSLVCHAEKFTTWINSDAAFARKFVRMSKTSPVLGRIDKDRLITFIRSKPHLSGTLKIVPSDDGDKINVTSKAAGKLFLKVLNDDFLRSDLTEFNYESIAKNQMQGDSPE